MNHELYIANSQIVFSFRRNLEIRKRIFEFEELLKEDFKVPFRSVAIPDDLDPNIPRFESQSIHGHSHIQVSQTRITLATNYNDAFKLNYKEVEEYIEKKTSLIVKLAKTENVDFVAYVIELGIYMNEEDINHFIKENTGIFAINNESHDFSILYSKKYKSDYYLNVNCSKFIEQEILLNNLADKSVTKGNSKRGISVILDINSKPYFEKNKSFNFDLFDGLKKEVFEIVNTKKVENFLKGDV